VLTLYLSASPGAQPRPEQVRQLYADILTRVASLPGVESAGLVSSLPLQRGAPPDDFQIEGRPRPAPGATAYNADYVMVTPGFFETLRIPLRRGRLLQPGDVEGAPLVAIVNQATARKYWPGEDPIGKRIRYFGDDAPWVTIVGIVGNVRSRELTAEPRPAIYAPHPQASRGPSYDDTGLLRFLSLVVRAPARPQELAPAVRAIFRERDPRLPLSSLMTMTEVVSRAAAQPRFTSLLMSLFAAAALLLAMVGIYGVMSYSVEQARHAIGIRMALGATTADVLGLVVVQGARMAAAGVGFGLAAAVLVTRSMGSLLYQVSPTDPATFGAIALILTLVSLLACYLRPGARLDPIEALRYE
jgi:putative ABC transport system permease protein